MRVVDAVYEIGKESLAAVRLVSEEAEVSELHPKHPERTEMGSLPEGTPPGLFTQILRVFHRRKEITDALSHVKIQLERDGPW